MTPQELLQHRLISAAHAADVEPLLPPGRIGLPVWARLCHAGLLEGGLSVALDVRPEELFGPLTHRIGGRAAKLKLTDVRGSTPVELVVEETGHSWRWGLARLEDLIDTLNAFTRDDIGCRQVHVLGEHEDMLQLWPLFRAQWEWMQAH